MINKKAVSLFLAIAFSCTLAVLPESRTESGFARSTGVTRVESDPVPRFREAEPEKEIARPAKKFPWLLVGGIVVGAAVGAFLIFTVFKKSHDIRGTWELDLDVTGEPRRTLRICFKGSKTQGDYNGDSYGTYSVEGKKVLFGYFTHGTAWNFIGEFSGREAMSGSYDYATVFAPAKTGTWRARKISSDTGAE